MANQQHLDILTKEGVSAWTQWRRDNPGIMPDLSRANFIGANLRGVNFDRATLSAVNFRKATNLSGVLYTGAKITGIYWPSKGVLTVV